MGNFSSKSPSDEKVAKHQVMKDVNEEAKKRTSGNGAEQPIVPIEPETAKKSVKKQDEEHHSYTGEEILAAEKNFQTIRKFLEKYHRAMNDEKVDRFLKILDQMKPLKDETSKEFIKEFNGSEGLANQHLLSLQNILTLWERESLSR